MRVQIAVFVVSMFAAIGFAVKADDDDDSNDLEIKITAPVEAVDATSSPNTITVLGLTIVVPPEALNGGEDNHHLSRKEGSDNEDDGDNNNNDDGDDNVGEHDDDDDDNNNGAGLVLSSLQVGQFVKVRLASDLAPLTATELEVSGAYTHTIKVQAPIQAVDTANNTVTVLGLIVDISTAAVDGCDDDDTHTTPTTPATLTVGQSVELVLDPAQLPALVALKIDVKNFTNQVDVQLSDKKGNQIENDKDDISVDVIQMVKVKDSKTGKSKRKPVTMHKTIRSGSVGLSGLSPGRARITVTRNGRTFRKTVTVAANTMSTVKFKVAK